jgi:hypothetical protein
VIAPGHLSDLITLTAYVTVGPSFKELYGWGSPTSLLNHAVSSPVIGASSLIALYLSSFTGSVSANLAK